MTITIHINRKFLLTLSVFVTLLLAAVISLSGPASVVNAAAQTTPCPPPTSARITMASVEKFERGWVLWIGDTRQMYVMINDAGSNNTGTVQVYPENWENGMPERLDQFKPPAGYWQPKRGIGKLWRENEAVRNGLGWGAKDSEGFMAVVASNGNETWLSGHDTAFKVTGNRWEEIYAWR
jgi:hypothetical protein